MSYAEGFETFGHQRVPIDCLARRASQVSRYCRPDRVLHRLLVRVFRVKT